MRARIEDDAGKLTELRFEPTRLASPRSRPQRFFVYSNAALWHFERDKIGLMRMDLDTHVPTEGELLALLDSDERTMSVVITNPWHSDNPMIYVSEEFEVQTGYPPEEALGRNCRFLQGPDTDPKAVEAIRAALEAQTTFTIDIVNYTKSGERFVNRLRIRPLFDDAGKLLYFAGVQNPI